MLFDWNDDTAESDKERNLCAKFFVGYFFNELVHGYEERLQRFCDLLNDGGDEPSVLIGKPHLSPVCLSPRSTHVTLDLHEYILNPNGDKGELADIFVIDSSSKTAIAIEAKFLEPWDFKKDICGNAERINRTVCARTNYTNGLRIVQCLLVTRTRWNDVKAKSGMRGSNYDALCACTNLAVVVLTWERLISLCEPGETRLFFENLIKRMKREFRRHRASKLATVGPV